MITFHTPPKDSSDSIENIDAYGLCGNSCTISSTTGWSPICMEDPYESFTFALGVDTRNGEVGSGKFCGTTNIIADWYGVADACLADSTCVAFGYRHTWSGGLVGRKCTQHQTLRP